MSNTAGLSAQITGLLQSVSALSGGVSADEAGVSVLADTMTQVVGVLSAVAERVTALETAEAARVAAELRQTLHIPA